MARDDTNSIYYSSDWESRRRRQTGWFNWYSGRELGRKTEEIDPDTDERVGLWPLEINPIAKACRIHRSVMVGMVDDYAELPVKIFVKGDDRQVQDFIRGVWHDSNGAALFQEAALLTQVHGGHAFKVAWEPWNTLLRHRIRVESIQSPWLYPIFDRTDYWNLRECFIGYPIDAETAESKYSIKANGPDAIYLEHWTKDHYEITVDGIVPEIEGYGRLEGDHNWGRVPIVYIPHLRDGDFWGRSLVEALVGLTKEKNARSADRGDAVREGTHPTLYIRNVTTSIKMKPLQVDGRGNVIKEAADLGSAKNMPNSHDPEAGYLGAPNVPQDVIKYDSDLNAEIMNQADVAPVLVGADDTASGRITGPVSNMRAVSTVQHCQAERIEFTTGLIHLTDIILRVAMGQEQGGQYDALKVEAPGIVEEHLGYQVGVTWPPMMPIEAMERTQMLTTRLQAGGISLESYLRETGCTDVEEEMARIEGDSQRETDRRMQEAEQQAKLKPAPAQKSGGTK